MSYKDAYHPNVKSDLKKLDKSVTRQIHHVHIEAILLNPFAHEKLHGDLEGVVSYHFRMNKVEYRIAYSVDESEQIVYFLMIGKRENFYEILKRRLS